LSIKQCAPGRFQRIIQGAKPKTTDQLSGDTYVSYEDPGLIIQRHYLDEVAAPIIKSMQNALHAIAHEVAD
jgi:hypothetical protein